jgi:hypothetical protein
VSYVQNGWGIGTGLLDEDGRTAHQAWLGKDPVSLSDTGPRVRADMDEFLERMAANYFSECRGRIQQVFPHTLYLGPNTLGTWGVPPRAAVLRAAGKSLDVIVLGGGTPPTQAMLEMIKREYGAKPFLSGTYLTANADSALFRYPDRSPYATQQERGEAYRQLLASLWSLAVTATGSHPSLGTMWWQYADDWSEKRNWGLVTNLDNAYDGREAVATPTVGSAPGGGVPCSPPLQRYACGGEVRDYGNVLGSVVPANFAWRSESVSPAAAPARESLRHRP